MFECLHRHHWKKGGPEAAWEVTRSPCCQGPPGGDPAGA
jgi:hypothetical protein